MGELRSVSGEGLFCDMRAHGRCLSPQAEALQQAWTNAHKSKVNMGNLPAAAHKSGTKTGLGSRYAADSVRRNFKNTRGF
jgi:hypothetical protein